MPGLAQGLLTYEKHHCYKRKRADNYTAGFTV